MGFFDDRKRLLIAGVVLVCVLAILVGVAIGVPLSKRSADPAEARAVAVLESVPLIDGHNDLPWGILGNVMNQLKNLNLYEDLRVAWDPPNNNYPPQTDIPRLRQGKLGAQFWVAFVQCKSQDKDAVRQTLEQIDVIKRMIKKFSDTFQYVTSAQGIDDAFHDGKIGSLIAVEGGHSIDNSLATLRMFYELGVRYMTITHSCNTPWADNYKVDLTEDPDPATSNGLSEFGKLVVKEMNRLGMLIDLSHTSVKTQEDTLEISDAPVMYSHSSVFSICNSDRNVHDSVLAKVRDNQGIVMVNFYNAYISCNRSVATLGQVADHLDYIKDNYGVDIAGIGADYDGVDKVPEGLEDVSTYPVLFTELVRRGWSDEDLEKVAGRNLLRVFRRVEEVRDSKQDDEPIEGYIPAEDLTNSTCRLSYWDATHF